MKAEDKIEMGGSSRPSREIPPRDEPLVVGTKDDGGKDRYDLLPFDALHEIVKVFTEGANKYADRNWELGISYNKLIASGMRHFTAFSRGKTINQDDFGLHHLAHAAWNCMALLAFELRGGKYKGFDDRIRTEGDRHIPRPNTLRDETKAGE